MNGKKKAVSEEIAQKKLEHAKAQLEAVERYLETLDENDLHEKKLNKPMALDLDKNHLPDPEKLKERIAFHEQCLKELAESERGALLFTDPEAGMMPAKEGGIKACYNVQTAVDAGSHMIVGFDVTNNSSDRGTIKHYDGAGYFLCKGKEKVTAEYALSCLGYDIRRAISICGGVKALIQRFKGIPLPKLPQLAEI